MLTDKQALRYGLERGSDLNKVPGLFKRGGKVKRKKRKPNRPVGHPPTTDYSDFSTTGNAPTDVSAVQFNLGGDIGKGLKTVGNFAGFIPGIGTLIGAGAGLAGSALESTDPDSPTGGKFNMQDFISSGMSGALGGFGGGNPLMVGAGENTFAYGGTIPSKKQKNPKIAMYAQGGRNFSSPGAYKRWLAYGHSSGQFASTPGHQKVSIKGEPHKVQHEMGGMMNFIPAEVEGMGMQEGTPLQMQRGELLTNGGKVLRNFVAGNPHSKGGFDITAQEGTIVIPKNQSKRYLDSGVRERKKIEKSLVSQQERREGNMMRKGGMVRKYQHGGPVTGVPTTGGQEEFLNPPMPGNFINIPMAPPPYRLPLTQTPNPIPNVYPGAPNAFTGPFSGGDTAAIDAGRFYGDDLYNRSVTKAKGAGQGTGFEVPAGPFSQTSAPGAGIDLGGWQKYASAAPLVANAIDYLQRPEQLNPKDFEVGQVGYQDQKFNREPFIRARASGSNSLRNIYANSPGAYRSSIGNLYSGFASKEQEARNQIDNQNAVNRMQVDATNLQAQGINKARALQIAEMNMANREARRNAGRQFATNVGKFADRQANLEFGFDQLEGAYGDQPGYKDRLRKSRRNYTWG